MPFLRRARNLLHDVDSVEALYARALAWGRASGRFEELSLRAERPFAEVNGGRWLVRCPNCGNGMLGDPDWASIACLECGRVYRPRYPNPPTVAAIEALLLVRYEGNQHWQPGEDMANLQRENDEHGLGAMRR